MYAHDLPVREMRRLCRRLHDSREQTLARLAQGLDTARALPAGLTDRQKLPCSPGE